MLTCSRLCMRLSEITVLATQHRRALLSTEPTVCISTRLTIVNIQIHLVGEKRFSHHTTRMYSITDILIACKLDL
jgi:hypothetical protein